MIAIVSTIQPETHYTRFLYKSLCKNGINALLWINKSSENKEYAKESGDNNIRLVWDNNWKLPWQIVRQVWIDKIELIHLQHEFNMYGKVWGLVTFPTTLFLLKLLGRRVVATIHAIPKLSEIDKVFLEMMKIDKICPNSGLARIFFRFFLGTVAKLVDKVIVHSDYTKLVCETDYKMRNVEVIPIGVCRAYPRSFFEKSKEVNRWEKLKSDKYILFFGYILERKGLEQLLLAFKKCLIDRPKLKLVLAGGFLKGYEDYVVKIKKIVEKLGLGDNVVFTGFVNGREVDCLYENTQVVVLPYVRSISSSFPLSFALGYGKPVVASDIGTLRGELQDGVNGLYCQPNNIDSLYQAIKEILSSKKFNKIPISKDSSWENVAKKTMLIYEQSFCNY